MTGTDLQHVQTIALQVRRRLTTQLFGAYHSAFKGRGMEFDSVRPYTRGDDVRSIDWNVTARTGEPYVKSFVEERKLTMVLAVDTSASMAFGSLGQYKSRQAIEAGAVLGFSAQYNRDNIGLLTFSEGVRQYIPPKSSDTHVMRLIRELVDSPFNGQGTQLTEPLNILCRILRQRSVIFVISDFLVPLADAKFIHSFLTLNERHEVIAIVLHDPLETNLPQVGLLPLRDLETGQLVWGDTDSLKWRQTFQEYIRQQQIAREATFQQMRIPYLNISSESNVVYELTNFFLNYAKDGMIGKPVR